MKRYERNERGQWLKDGKCEPVIGFGRGYNAAVDDIESIVKEYVEARDAYEDATGIHRVSFAHPKRLPHGDAITRRWVDARAALYKAIGHVKLGEVRIEHAT